MPVLKATLRRLAFIAVVALVSGVAWLASWQVAQAAFGFTQIESVVTLVYVPAGIRLVILLIAGVWGVLGIALVYPFALLQVFPDCSWPEVCLYSAIAGFVPWAALYATCRIAGITRNLGSLRAIHLPLLAIAVSISGALAFMAALTAFGRFPASKFLEYAAGMTAGDFLGCFAVVLLVRLVVITSRKLK